MLQVWRLGILVCRASTSKSGTAAIAAFEGLLEYKLRRYFERRLSESPCQEHKNIDGLKRLTIVSTGRAGFHEETSVAGDTGRYGSSLYGAKETRRSFKKRLRV